MLVYIGSFLERKKELTFNVYFRKIREDEDDFC